MKDSLGATGANDAQNLPLPTTETKLSDSHQPSQTEKRGRTNSFFSMYSAGATGEGQHHNR